MTTATSVAPPVARDDTHEAIFRAMGTDAHVIVVGGPSSLLDEARRRIEVLEGRWSRFRPTSELCRLNAAGGAPVVVSGDTFALIEHACDAWARTSGAFDPTVLDALEIAGYDSDFDSVARDGPHIRAPGEPAPGCVGIVLDPIVRAVTLPAGVRIDLGGIGKGYAADLVTGELLRTGVAGACVNLGGDLRVAGEPPSGDAWVVEVELPVGIVTGASRPLLLALADGAVATTSRCGRVWRRGDELQHHVIDPRSSAPAVTPWAAATVVAGLAVDAEPLAKAALLARTPADADAALCDPDTRAPRACGLLVDASGALHSTPGLEAFLAS